MTTSKRSKRRGRRIAGAVRQLPSGRWQARVRDPITNRLVSLGSFTTAAEADAALSRASTDQVRGAWVRPERSRLTLGEWSERWYATTTNLRPSTRASYRYALDRLILPGLGAAQLGNIDALAVRRWLASLHSTDLSPATVAKGYRVLSQAIAAAVESGYLATSPCVVKGAGTESSPEMRCPTAAEIRAVADEVPERYEALVLLAGLAGLRWGECIGLRRHRVDLLHRTVTVAEQATEVEGSIVVGLPKTEAGLRTVALPAQVLAALTVHLERHAEATKQGLVFPAPAGGYLRRTNFMTRTWRPAATRAGCEGLRFHDLRHGAATIAATVGATTKELMGRLGHASPAAALRYQHVVSGRDQTIAERIDALVPESEPIRPTPAIVIGSSRKGHRAS